jgi:hypothetical protein
VATTACCFAGLGWIAVGVKGAAEFRVWVAPGVQVTTRAALVPDYARDFCRPGFSIALPNSSQKGKGGGGLGGGAKKGKAALRSPKPAAKAAAP